MVYLVPAPKFADTRSIRVLRPSFSGPLPSTRTCRLQASMIGFAVSMAGGDQSRPFS